MLLIGVGVGVRVLLPTLLTSFARPPMLLGVSGREGIEAGETETYGVLELLGAVSLELEGEIRLSWAAADPVTDPAEAGDIGLLVLVFVLCGCVLCKEAALSPLTKGDTSLPAGDATRPCAGETNLPFVCGCNAGEEPLAL